MPGLEDELGDVLEKGMKLAGLREADLATRTGIDINRIKDALLYRYDFRSDEIDALASVLELNEVGFRALAEGRYPMPSPGGLPFKLHVLAMPYGVGVVNAYIVTGCQSDEGILFDSGSCGESLHRAWPEGIKRLSAHLVTHWESDHVGGCRETMKRFNLPHCLGPGPEHDAVHVLDDRAHIELGDFRVEVISTPGPAREHYCYLVGRSGCGEGRKVLFTGDLFFCGSVGGGFFDTRAVLEHARRLWRELPGDTLVAPGHGPLSTIETEREFNPFSCC